MGDDFLDHGIRSTDENQGAAGLERSSRMSRLRTPRATRSKQFGFCVGLVFAIASTTCLRLGHAETEPASTPQLGGTIDVPFDHQSPDLGNGSIYFELSAPYDESKPVVFVIADAQQFYVRRGKIAGIQEEYFGSDFNVVGIVGRGSSQEFVEAALDQDGEPDWERAWRIFQSEQWVDDIEAVRLHLVGAQGKVSLYGESGGALLVHQYLTRYGDHIERAITPASVNRFIEARLGLNSDRFWKEIGDYEPSLQDQLLKALELYAEDRSAVMMTLQRQNFFVPPEHLQEERARLIRALAEGDERLYTDLRKRYEVDQVREIMASTQAIPIRVRVFEFIQPLVANVWFETEAISPDLEMQRDVAGPLMELYESHRISVPDFEMVRLHDLNTEVLVIAGRWDHTVDYRSSIALAACYPNHFLYIADDDHMFQKLKNDGHFRRLIGSFFQSGIASSVFAAAVDASAPHRWREQ
jgi:pimeloyl-ACP methyl ester carboxylesterase